MKKLISLLQISVVLSLATPFITNARDLTWTGAASGNWNDSANFSPMFVPTANDTVTIDAATHHPRLTNNASAYRLVLLDDTFDLNGYQLNIANEALFSGGWLVDGSLECRGTIATFAGTVFNAAVDVDCTTLQLNGSVFNHSCNFKAETGDSQGGNIFMAPVSLVHVGTAGESITMTMDQGDIFHDTLSVSNNSDGNIHLTQTDTSYFKNCVRISSTGIGSIHFGREGGISILETNGHLVVENGDFTVGQLFIKNIEQQNTTGHRMVLTGTGSSDEHSLLSIENCLFTGEVDFTAPNLLLSVNRFDGEALFTKTGGYDNVSTGDNLFSQNASFTNSSTTGHLLLTGSREDRFLGTAQFTSGSMRVISGYGATTIFEGDVVVNASTVGFYRLKFTGEAEQTLSGSVGHLYGETELDKASGSVTANVPIAIDRRLTFTKGYLITDSVNLVTFLASGSASGATDSSFVAGPVKKVGNTAFDFPVGKDGHFRPLTITATDSVGNSYLAEYFNTPQLHGASHDTTLEYIAYCNYWNLQRVTGIAKVAVTIGWDSAHCGLYDSARATIARWENHWINMEIAGFEGTALQGRMTSQDSLEAAASDITFAYRLITSIVPAPQHLDATVSSTGRSLDHFFGLNGTNVIQPGASWDVSAMHQQVAGMQPSTIRYPGGTTGNWWDWRKGWFVDRNTPFQNCDGLSAGYENLAVQNNHLVTFRNALGTIGSRPLFLLNMLTSDPAYQIAMLHEARILGMPVQQVELGEEFYIDGDCEYEEIFPSAGAYAGIAEYWMEVITDRFPQVELAIVGSDYRPNNPNAVRRNTWNTGLGMAGMSPSPNAVAIHPYYGSGLNLSANGNCGIIDYINSNNSPDDLFLHAFTVLDQIDGHEYLDLNSSDIWMTEYNLFDSGKGYIHGSWAHGLKTAAFTMAMLQHDWIEKVNCHTMVGHAVFSSFFSSEQGFVFSDDPSMPSTRFCSASDAAGAMPTGAYSMTSVGYALSEISRSLRFATAAHPIEFTAKTGSSIPVLGVNPNTMDGVYGWQMMDDEGNEQLIILNMSNEEVTIDFSSASNMNTPQLMKLISMPGAAVTGPNVLNTFITKVAGGMADYVMLNPATMPIIGNFTISGDQPYVNATLIPPYSLMHYSYYASGQQSVSLSASETSVCDGRNFYLYANAGPNADHFEWHDNTGIIGNTTTPTFLATANGNGPYHVVVTFANASTVTSNSLAISIETANTLSINPPSATICASTGTPVTLEASLSGSGTNHFCWIGIDGAEIHSSQASQLTHEIQVMPEQTSTYMVYATDGTCSVREEITIEVIGNIDFGADPITFCENSGGLTLTTGLDPQQWDFLWSDQSTGFSLNVNPATPQTYSVTVDNNAGCTVTASVGVIPIECCTIPGAIVLTGNVNVKDLLKAVNPVCSCVSLSPTGTNIIDNTGGGLPILYIEGELLVEDDLEMQNVNLRFAERGRLIVDSYRTLTLLGCTLTTCSSSTPMWQGVLVREKGRLVTDDYSSIECEISNAYHGVWFERMSSGWLRRTTFKDNFIGLRSLGAPSGMMVAYRKTLGRCTFESSIITFLPPPYGNIPSLSPNGNYGYAGIVADNDLITITSASTNDPSLFDQFSNGIVATNSILNISNTRFWHMQPETVYNGLGELGKGILLSGIDKWCSLKLTGVTSGVSTATFEHCIDGISAARSAVDVSGAGFSNVERGIVASQSYGHRVSIMNNTINASTRGIDLMEMDMSGRVTISNNTINMDHPTSAIGVRAISIENYGFMGTPQHSLISCNTIHLDRAEHGIFVNSLNQTLPPTAIDFNLGIHENTITASDNSFLMDGIALVNCKHFGVTENTVNGDGTTGAGTGYRFMMSPEGAIHNNFSSGTHRGFYFQNASWSAGEFRNNTMEVNFRGLEVDPSGFIGIQAHRANNWTGYNLGTIPYEPVSGNHTGAFNFNQTGSGIQFNRFIIDDNHTIGSSRYPRYLPVNSNWFYPLDGVETIPYYLYCASIEREMNPVFNELDSLIATDSISSSAFQPELREISKMALYEKVKVISENNNINEFFSDFMEDFLLTSTGRILSVRDSVYSALNLAHHEFLLCYRNDSLWQAVLDEYVQNVEQGEASFWSDTLIAYLQILRNPLDSLISGYQNKIQALVAGGITALNAITTGTIVENNLKTALIGVMEVLSGQYDAESLIVSQTPIASQCPEEGGPGVLVSRSILNRLGTRTGYHDELLCYPPERLVNLMPSPVLPNTGHFIIFPNPGTGVFTVKTRSDLPHSILQIVDIYGREIEFEQKVAENNSYVIDISDKTPGIYFLYVYDAESNSVLHTSRVIVISR